MTDQAAPLYQLASHAIAERATPAQESRVIVVVGTRPAAGATTTAINLAQSLSESGQEAVVIDADVGQPDATYRMGLQPNRSLADLIQGDITTCDAIYPSAHGIAMIAGSIAPIDRDLDRQTVGSRVAEASRWLRGHFDWTLIDGGRLDDRLAIQLHQHATHTVLVVDEQTDAVDAYTAITKLVRQKALVRQEALVRHETAPHAPPITLLFNRTMMMDDATAKYRGIQRTARQFLDIDISLAGYVYENENPSQLLGQLTQTLSGARTAAVLGKNDLTIQLTTLDGR